MMIGLVATSLLASCKKNNNDNNGGTANGQGFRASTEQNIGDSKTHLNGTSIMWNENDLIKVRNNVGTVLTYQLTDGEDSPNGTFYTGEAHDGFFQEPYTAIYPATDANSINESGTAAMFSLPAAQTFVANGFANGAMPMTAVSATTTLNFKNVLGGLVVRLKGPGITVNRIVLFSNKEEALWGNCTATIGSDGAITGTSIPYTNANQRSITLNCGNLSLPSNADDYIDFYILVPGGSFSKGFVLQVFDNNNRAVYSTSTEGNPNIERNKLVFFENPVKIVIGGTGGVFSGCNGRKLRFAKGNLQYNPLSRSWQFADHGYDVIDRAQQGIDGGAEMHFRDYFLYGTSNYIRMGSNNQEMHYRPWCRHAYGQCGENHKVSTQYWHDDLTGNADWGYNKITNGGNVEGMWFTPSKCDWDAIFSRGAVPMWAAVKITDKDNMYGIAILPDGWKLHEYDGRYALWNAEGGFIDPSYPKLNYYNEGNVGVLYTSMTSTEWDTQFEPLGAVLLPYRGMRDGNGNWYEVGGADGKLSFFYWSSSIKEVNGNNADFRSSSAWCLFGDNNGSLSGGITLEAGVRAALPVRLVCLAE